MDKFVIKYSKTVAKDRLDSPSRAAGEDLQTTNTHVDAEQQTPDAGETEPKNINADEEQQAEAVISEEAIASTSTATCISAKKRKWQDRSFRDEWAEDYPWLENKNGKGYCKYCNKVIEGGAAHLKRHSATLMHNNRTLAVKKTPDLTPFLKLNENTTHTHIHFKTKAAEYKLAALISEHNLPMLIMDHLPKLLASADPDSRIFKQMNCARTKVTKMISAIEEDAVLDLKKILNDREYSVMIDETTDLSTKKELAIVVRYVDIDRKKTCDRLLALVEINDCTAQGIFDKLLETFTKKEISMEKLIGFAADNAAVMMGDYNGVKVKLINNINKDIFVTGCICHSLHLAASAAANVLPSRIEGFCRDIYNYLSNSPKRLDAYKEFQEFVKLKPHKILKPSQTRWLSLEMVVNRILEQWPALNLFFISASQEDNLESANNILMGLQNGSIKLYYTFLSYILHLVNQLNLEFQGGKPQLHSIYSRVNTLYRTILKNFMNSDYVNSSNLLKDINPNNPREYLDIDKMYLGAKTEEIILSKPQNLTAYDIRTFKINCLKYYVELGSQIRKRFYNIDQYRNFKLLNPSDVIKEPGNVTPLLIQFPNLCENLEETALQYRMISNLDKEIKTKIGTDFETFWFSLYDIKNSDSELCFGSICRFVFKIMSLAHSNAATERIFSQLSLIKTKSRNRLLSETCSSLIMAKEFVGCNGGNCYSFEPSQRLLNKNIKY